MLSDVDKIQDMINALPVSNPMLSAIEEKRSRITLSQAFMREAEKARPWTAISFNDWLSAGRWWLLKAQSKLYTEATSLTIPVQAYTDLLKASWILVDIFPNHPLRRYWIGEYLQVELLADELKRELARTESKGLQKPATSIVEQADLRIWMDETPEVDITPATFIETESLEPGDWQTQEDVILWRGFASLRRPDYVHLEDCIVLVLMSKASPTFRMICQNQQGRIVLGKAPKFLDSLQILRRAHSTASLDLLNNQNCPHVSSISASGITIT